MKYSFLTMVLGLAIFLLSGTAFSQILIEPCKFGQPLIDEVRAQYAPPSTLGYSKARDTLWSKIDAVNHDLFCMYTDFRVALDPNADPTTSAFQNGNGINAEHVYPQAFGAGSEPARSDMHNIFPSKVNVNSSRGNCEFKEIDDNDTDVWFFRAVDQTIKPTSNIDDFSEKDHDNCGFEPREVSKGDVARAVFYFYMVYQTQAKAANPAFFPNQKATLLQWHYQDLPDAKERRRDSLIAIYQGNHNPFILDSTLAKRAYFMANASYPPGDTNCFSLSTSITQPIEHSWLKLATSVFADEVVVKAPNTKGQIELLDLHGRRLRQQVMYGETRVSLKGLTNGAYLLRAIANDRMDTLRIWKQE